jgi:hypothetical protein
VTPSLTATVTPVPTTTPTNTPTNSPTPSPIPEYWQVEQLTDCCTDFSSGPWIIKTLDGSTPSVGDTIAINLGEGDGTRCYIINGGVQTTEETSNRLVVTNYGSSNCFDCTQSYICPSPTPTPTVTPSITPTNAELALKLYPCNDGEPISGNFILFGIPDNGAYYIDGTDGVRGCFQYFGDEPSEGANFLVQSLSPQYEDCQQCNAGPPPSPTATPTKTPSSSIAPTVTPTRTKTPTVTRSVTPTRTKTPTPTPSATPACGCINTGPANPTTVTIYESIAAPSSAALYQNISEWYSYLVPCRYEPEVCCPPYLVNSTKPLSLQTQTNTDTFETKSFSYMISFKYVQVSVASANIRIAVGTGLQGDCSYGVYNIPSPVNNTWYTLRVDISDVTVGGSQIRCHISTPLYSSYNYCTSPGSQSCCSPTASGTGTFPTCPTITNGCIISGEIGGYWCPY